MTVDWAIVMAKAGTAFAAGRLAEAEAEIEAAVQRGTAPAAAWNLAALVRLRRGRKRDAVVAAKRAVSADSHSPGFLHTLGLAQDAADRREEAARAFRRAIALKGDVPIFHYNLGNALWRDGKIDEAVEPFRTATMLDPNFAPAFHNMGRCLYRLGQLGEAMNHFQTALALQPDYPEARFSIALLHLAQGRFAAGWPGYEHRWAMRDAVDNRAAHPQPRWDGRALRGETLLLWCEQGLGDNLQFIRLLSTAVAKGATVLVECPQNLCRLFSGIPGVTGVFATGTAPTNVAWQLPMASLPVALEWTPEHASNQGPYLFAPDDTARALPVASARLKVGVVWGGRRIPDPARSCPMTAFRRLFAVPDIAFYSLQWGEWRDDLARLPPKYRPVDLGDWVEDFADMAGILQQLDLVITIDTATAHMAGAMGRPTWMMLPHRADWRWLLDTDRSPWYPTMRLYRQERQGDWLPVLARIATDLAALTGDGLGR